MALGRSSGFSNASRWTHGRDSSRSAEPLHNTPISRSQSSSPWTIGASTIMILHKAFGLQLPDLLNDQVDVRFTEVAAKIDVIDVESLDFRLRRRKVLVLRIVRDQIYGLPKLSVHKILKKLRDATPQGLFDVSRRGRGNRDSARKTAAGAKNRAARTRNNALRKTAIGTPRKDALIIPTSPLSE